MSASEVDRNLLFGFLALQQDFIAREDLIASVSVWLTDKSRSLDEILRERNALAEDEQLLIAALVRKYVQRNAEDVQKSLASLSSIGGLREELTRLGDQDVEASLAHVTATGPADNDPLRTLPIQDSSLNKTRFRIIRPHAEGGIGRVFVAHDQELNREVALKEIKSLRSDDLDSRSRFVLEAEITGGLEHPGIVPVYGLGQYSDGRPYYAMRFIRGDSLGEAVDQFHRQAAGRNAFASVEFRKLLGRFIDVCNAIEYAHSRGVLHRDLKPGNIMLGKYGETLVVDWGLAKVSGRDKQIRPTNEQTLHPRSSINSSATVMGSAIGTPAFMSPEQAAGQLDQLGPATDVYSLGATLYYLLTGKPPIDKEDTIGTVLKKVQSGIFPSPRSINPNIPIAIEAICLKAMQRDVHDRYPSPVLLADEVDRFLAEEKVEAHRESFWIRSRRWFRKHPRSVAAATTMLLVGVVSAMTGSLIVGQKNQQLANANSGLKEANAAQLATTVTLLEQAPAEAVPAILQGMESVRDKYLPILESHWKKEELTDSQRIRLALALLPNNESVTEFLHSQLLAARPVDSIMIRNALKPRSKELAKFLWKALQESNLPPEQQLRSAAALSEFDQQNPRWNEIAKPTVAAMLAANPFDWGVWIDGLRPAREHLLPALAERFRDRTDAEQHYVAAVISADYAAEQPEVLADLVADAQPRQLAVLLPRLQRLVDSVAPILERELTRTCMPEWNDLPISKAGQSVDNENTKLVEQSEGLITDAFAFVTTLPREKFKSVHEAMSLVGYRLVRLRPFANAGSVQVAAIWLRDGLTCEYLLDASPKEIKARDEVLRGQGFLPVDVSGYTELAGEPKKTKERYAAVWCRQPASAEGSQRQLIIGSVREPEVNGINYFSFQEFLGVNGTRRFCTLGEKQTPGSLPSWNRNNTEYVDVLRRMNHLVQHDVSVSTMGDSEAMVRRLGELLAPTGEKNFRHQYSAVFNNDPSFRSTELHGLSPIEHTRRASELADGGWRPSAIAVGAPAQMPALVASVWQQPLISDDRKEKLARRRANAAIALMLLGRPDKTWNLFRHTAEPSTRSWLIHLLGPYSVPPELITDRLAIEDELSAQRALWLAVGELTDKLDDATRTKLISQLERIFQEHADSGLHSVAEWTLRRLHRDDELDLSDRTFISTEPSDNSWYVTPQGHTMSVFRGPLDFVQGSPKGEKEQYAVAETPWPKRINRTIAISNKEVSLRQFQKFQSYSDNPLISLLDSQKYAPDPQCPVLAITWYEAAKYCRWLSEKEGIPESEMCFPPIPQIKDGMKLPANYLQRTGYRMPTEAEWEFACRAGAITSRCYGGSEELLGKYSRYVQNSNDHTWPCGRLKPNDFGMFDMHGNIWEWCQNGMPAQVSLVPEVVEDRESADLRVTVKNRRVLRGGSFDRNSGHIRCASGLVLRPDDNYLVVGLRIARTLPDPKP